MLSKFLSVVFTEYQLIQVESICCKFDFEQSDLLIANTERISNKLIDTSIFDNIYYLPSIHSNGSIQKLFHKYIREYEDNLRTILKNKNYNILIGASDENTAMGIIKNFIQSESYWSIEDGIGNYREFNFWDDFKIFLKKLLFNKIYKSGIEIIAQKGNGKIAKSFRIDPSLTVNKGIHEDLSGILRDYFTEYETFYSNIVNENKAYDQVIIVNREIENQGSLSLSTVSTLVKKHPKYISKEEEFSVQNIPIEALPVIFKNIQTIVYDSYFCSSILNILSIYNNIDILLSFDIYNKYKNKSIINLFHKIKSKYGNRIKII